MLSESGNSMEMNVLTKSIEEIEAKIQPQNKKYVSDNHDCEFAVDITTPHFVV